MKPEPQIILAGLRVGLLFTAAATNLFLIYFIHVTGLPLFISWLIFFAAVILLLRELKELLTGSRPGKGKEG